MPSIAHNCLFIYRNSKGFCIFSKNALNPSWSEEIVYREGKRTPQTPCNYSAIKSDRYMPIPLIKNNKGAIKYPAINPSTLECMRWQVTYHGQRTLCVERTVTRKSGMRFRLPYTYCTLCVECRIQDRCSSAQPVTVSLPRTDFKFLQSFQLQS